MYYRSEGPGRLLYEDESGEPFPSLNAIVAGKCKPEFNKDFSGSNISGDQISGFSFKGRSVLKDNKTLKIKGAGVGAYTDPEILEGLIGNIEKIFPEEAKGKLIELLKGHKRAKIRVLKGKMPEEESNMKEKVKGLLEKKKEELRRLEEGSIPEGAAMDLEHMVGGIPVALKIEHSYGRPFGAVDAGKGRHEVKMIEKLRKRGFPTPPGEFEVYPAWVQKTAEDMSNAILDSGNLRKLETKLGRIKIPYEGRLITRMSENIALMGDGVKRASIEAFNGIHKTLEDIVNKGKTLHTGNYLRKKKFDVTWTPSYHSNLIEKPNGGREIQLVDLEGFQIKEGQPWEVGGRLSEVVSPLFRIVNRVEDSNRLETAREFLEKSRVEPGGIKGKGRYLISEIPINGERHLLVLGQVIPGSDSTNISGSLKEFQDALDSHYEEVDLGY